MKEQGKQAPGFDDIIFENRNKEYGAYNLRRRYYRTLLLALLIGMFLLSAAVIGPYVRAKGATMTKTEDKEEEVFVQMERLDQPDEEVVKIYAPPPPPQEMVVQTVKYVAPQVVDTVLPEQVSDLMTMDESVKNVQDEGVAAHIEYVTGPEQEEVVPEEEQVFFIVEEMPSFQGGGEDAFRDWIAKNLRYPEIAADNGISGRVYVQFAVNSKGEVCDAVVVRGVDPALDKEALRVVLSSPRWEPGRQRGRPVKVQFTFPINFILQ
jgi:periplasmic protein TonB